VHDRLVENANKASASAWGRGVASRAVSSCGAGVQGDKRAYIKLGWMHWEPERFLKRMLSQARRWAARSPLAAGRCHTDGAAATNGRARTRQGRTVADLHLEGARWFQMAAEDVGDPRAQVRIVRSALADARGNTG
jgi:hypothetical protein